MSAAVCTCEPQNPSPPQPTDGDGGRAQTVQGQRHPVCPSGPGSCGGRPLSRRSSPCLAGTHTWETLVDTGLSARLPPGQPGPAGRSEQSFNQRRLEVLGLGRGGPASSPPEMGPTPVRPPPPWSPAPRGRPEASAWGVPCPLPPSLLPHPHCWFSSRRCCQRSFVAASGAGADGLGGAPGTNSGGRLLEETGKKIRGKSCEGRRNLPLLSPVPPQPSLGLGPG